MGRRGYVLFAAGIPALFAAGALGASCSLETAGITGSGSSASGIPSASSGGGAGGMGDAGGAGTGGEPPSTDPETCPGADVHLGPISPITMPGTLVGRNHDLTPSCPGGGMAEPDVIYRVFPETDGTLKVSLDGAGDFKGSLSIRSSCEDSVVPVELGCDEKTFVQRAWVRANAPYYVVVSGEPRTFSITFTLTRCGDGKRQELEECDGPDCTGCLACDQAVDFWDDPVKKQRCYRFVPKKASFAEARQACLVWGGDLAGINDKAELTFLQNFDLVATAEDVWVGGYAREAKCSYVWTDGEPGFPWDGFGEGEPTSPAGTTKEQCLGLYRQSTPLHSMDDQPCDVQRSYLCERAPAGSCGDGVIQPGEECDDANPSCQNCLVRCEKGEFKDGISHHCYRLSKEPVTREAAKASCELSNGYLAVITSQEENDFLAKRVKAALGAGAELWLGLTSLTPPLWEWDRKGERSLCAAQWKTGQPTMDGGTCATIHEDGGWTNRQCASAHGYLCERGP